MEDQDLYMTEYEAGVVDEIVQRDWEADDTRVIPDPKPQKRHRATKAEWEEIRRWFATDVCWVCRAEWQSLHHIYPRGQGGDDLAMNLAPVCGSGTSGCHGKLEARDPTARAAIRARLTDTNKWYLTWKLGLGAQAWLDKNYAELQAEAA